MYTRHFNMTDTPFSEQPPAEHLFTDEGTEAHLARLRYFLHGGRIATITGCTGVGKSSLLRLLEAELDGNLLQALRINSTRLGATALLRSIVEKLGEHSARGRERLFMQLDEKTRGCARSILLVIDDAHLLSPDALIDLRLLADSSHDDGTPCFRILLSGQEELARTLRQDRFSDLQDRIHVRVRLHPFADTNMSSRYIDRRLKAVGASAKIFSPDAIARIHAHTGGIRRRINNAATACLLQAVSRGVQIIDEPLCLQALQEIAS